MSILQDEIAFFNNLADEWWDLNGPQAMLHRLNPLRVKWISGYVNLKGIKVLDVGCGAGILTESLAEKGAEVTGIDLAEDLIHVAKNHAERQALSVDYQCIAIETIAAEYRDYFDCVTCLEMLEHVDDFESILQQIHRVLKPGGQVFIATINRTPRSFIEAILGAEYVLKLIPKGTHHYQQFIRPDELCAAMRNAGLNPVALEGMTYHPFLKTFSLVSKPRTNYWVVGEKLK